LQHRFERVRERIASAALRYGRSPQSVGLLAISKSQPIEAMQVLVQLGQRDFGENYLQEALPKLTALAERQLVWHFTGQLQANKTREIAEHFQWVHTVDRERIAVRLNEQRPQHAPPLNVCIQVSLAAEAGKGGIEAAQLPDLARCIERLPRLRLRGLMCIPPPAEQFEAQRAAFEQLTALLQGLTAQGGGAHQYLDTLSMGMSEDLEAAVAAGATWLRIGTALFGART
jgi:pyridoxal phosphate enzyme (YggS family)